MAKPFVFIYFVARTPTILAAAAFLGGFLSIAIRSKSRLKDGCRQNWPPYNAVEMIGTTY